MGPDKYSVDGDGRIRPLDGSVFAPDAWKDAPSFEEALAAAGKVAIGCATLGSRKESWMSELVAKHLLELEEGASLVTGINCRRGLMPFVWGDQTFYAVRPDFGFLVITTRFEVEPLNSVERKIYGELFKHRDAIFSLHLAVTHGQPDPASVQSFKWWLEFWNERGIAIQQGGGYLPLPRPTSAAPAATADSPGRKPGHVSPKDLACSIALKILDDDQRRPKRGHGRQIALVRMVLGELRAQGIEHGEDWGRKEIGPTFREWEHKNPDN